MLFDNNNWLYTATNFELTSNCPEQTIEQKIVCFIAAPSSDTKSATIIYVNMYVQK